MLVESLEKFEDLFQPYSPEEAEKRFSTFVVVFFPYEEGVNSDRKLKSVEVKAATYTDAIERAIVQIRKGLPRVMGYSISFRRSDGIKDDSGNVMYGEYDIHVDESELD